MSAHLLLRGWLLGLAIAAPVGPIGLLCIRRSLLRGWRAGFACGLGAASADALYALAGALSLGLLTHWLLAERTWVAAGGGLFLIYLGARTLRASPAPPALRPPHALPAATPGGYATTLILTLANPMTVLSFTAVFASAAAGGTPQTPLGASAPLRAAAFAAAVFMGSALWWLLLSTACARARTRLTPAALRWIDRTSGLVIAGFGIYVLASVLVRQRYL